MKYTRLSPEEIRNAIYEESKKQFLLRGIAFTETKQVARTIGIGRTTLYRYFPQKSQLVFMTAIELVQKFFFVNLTTDIKKNVTSFEKLEIYCERLTDVVLSDASIIIFFAEFDSLYSQGYPVLTEADEYSRKTNDNIKTIAQCIEEGKRDGSIRTSEDPIIFATILTGTILGLGQRLYMLHARYWNDHDATVLKTAVKLILSAIKA